MKLIRRHNFLDYLHQTESPEELLHAPKSGDVAAVDEGHLASSFLSSLRQNVLPIRGQGVHKTGSREKTIARCVLFSFFFFFAVAEAEANSVAFHNMHGDSTTFLGLSKQHN